MNLGPLEILVILVIALIVFGPKRLPEVARQVGGAMRELRRMQDTVRHELRDAIREPTPTLPARTPKEAERQPPAVGEPDHTDAQGYVPPTPDPDDDESGFAGPAGSFS